MTSHNYSLDQRGAMFGLDARIALAILGLLTLATGGAIYTVVQEAGAKWRLKLLADTSKAIETFIQDTNLNPTNALDLVQSTPTTLTEGWRGPYVTVGADSISGTSFLSHGKLVQISIHPDTAWNSDYYIAPGTCTNGTSGCYIWTRLADQEIDIVRQMDEVLDGGDGLNIGRLRYYDSTMASPTRGIVFYQASATVKE